MPKGIFIGLGGTGVTTVAKLKAMLFKRAYNSDLQSLKSDCTFIFYDTDSGAKEKMLRDEALLKMMGGVPVIDQGREWVDAGTTSPRNMYDNAKNAKVSDARSQRLLEWAIDPEIPGHFILPRKQLSQGAAAERMAGRTGFAYKKDDLELKIKTGLQSMIALKDQGANLEIEKPAIWVFGSACGGTSSSALMDVLYLIDRLYRKEMDNYTPYIRLVLYMPKAFNEKNINNANYPKNSYSTLWELNEFRIDHEMQNDGGKFGAFAAVPDETGWSSFGGWPVCSYVMAVDRESQKGIIDAEQMYDCTAELCYFLHTGAAGQSMISNLDNDISGTGGFFKHPFETQDDPFKWSRFLVGSGYKAIVKADAFLKDYVKKRFLNDLYQYGLLGCKYEEVWTDTEQRKKAAKEFADKYILPHLLNLDRPDMSPKGSLYWEYMQAFEPIVGPSETDNPTKDDWQSMGTVFTTDCKTKYEEIVRRFETPGSADSKQGWIKKIEASVKKGVDENVIQYGLRYAFQLLNWVDDTYCEQDVISRLDIRDLRRDLETDIDSIIEAHANRPKKGIADLVAKTEEYKEAVVRELAMSHIKAIIDDITKENTGLLEYMRRGNPSYQGIRGILTAFDKKYSIINADYVDLASTFSNTSRDDFSEYFPRVSEFVDEGNVWKKGHLFEELYSSIVPIDTSVGSYEAGYPPIREGENGLSSILLEIKNKTNHDCFFADLALCNPMTDFSNLSRIFYQQVDAYIESAINSSNHLVKPWLDTSLAQVFQETYTSDTGEIDEVEKQRFVTRFTNGIPVFYPLRAGALKEVTDRWIFAGATQQFAATMGFDQNNPFHQYVADPSLGNRLLVCKIEVGHNFYEYKHFSDIKAKYENDVRAIMNQESGCHIHKDFVYRNIQWAFDTHKQQRFNDFVSLCWYDCFFEYLNEQTNKSHIEYFFGKAMGIPSMPGGLGAPTAGMGPGRPAIPSFGQAPAGTFAGQVPSGPAVPGGGQMPAGPAVPGGGQMPGVAFVPGGGQVPGTAVTGGSMSVDTIMGYKPIVSLQDIGTLKIIVESLKMTGNHQIGFGRNKQKSFPTGKDSLTSIKQGIIDINLEYGLDYFALFSEVYENLSANVKQEIAQMFYNASIIYQGNGGFYGEIWNRFYKKIETFFSAYKQTAEDENVWYQLFDVVANLSQKNIFY